MSGFPTHGLALSPDRWGVPGGSGRRWWRREEGEPGQHPRQAVGLLGDHCHPAPEGLCSVVGDPVDVAGGAASGSWHLPRLEEAVADQVGEGPVHRRPVHRAEAEAQERIDESVPVSWLLGKEQQERRVQEVPRRSQLEAASPRHRLDGPRPCGEVVLRHLVVVRPSRRGDQGPPDRAPPSPDVARAAR